jgi:hypothetical protein
MPQRVRIHRGNENSTQYFQWWGHALVEAIAAVLGCRFVLQQQDKCLTWSDNGTTASLHDCRCDSSQTFAVNRFKLFDVVVA